MVLDKLVDSIIGPLQRLSESVLGTIPGLVAALIVLVVGFVVALFVRWVVSQILSRIDLDLRLKRIGSGKILGDLKLSYVLSELSRWYTFILFLPPAADVISTRLNWLSSLLVDIARWIPNLIAGVIVLIFGFLAAEYIANRVSETKAKHSSSIGGLAKFVVVLATVLIFLRQIGVNVGIAEKSFIVVLAGVMGAIALGFGLGLKDVASDLIKDFRKRL
ncbi:hypothetical protein HY486_04840 [Candidatus Woesearchaeota archaeon]|nr:hypothetical protein [Candidatus Woesearchaeota archaeon]